MRVLLTVILCSVVFASTAVWAGNQNDHRYRHPKIGIKVVNLDTGMPIKQYDTLNLLTPYQVTVINRGADCAGQYVVTALGDSSVAAPPSVIVQFEQFIIGPSVASKSFTGDSLPANVLPEGYNDYKVTASCNGAKPHQRSFAFFEFFVEAN